MEKKDDDFEIMKEQMHKNYTDTLQIAIDMFKKNHPEKYKKNQRIGESLMDCDYEVTNGKDLEGEKIRLDNLKRTINDYNLTREDLTEEEIKLLQDNNIVL